MTDSKNMPLAMSVLGLLATASFAEIKVSDNLSVSGFLDMSAHGMQSDDVDPTLDANVDQYELDFMYKYNWLSARVDLNAVGSDAVTLEQGFVNAAFTPSLSMSMGRFLSSLGFEAAEPTGLYQYTSSLTTVGVYPGYQNGLNIAYTSPMFGFYAAAVTNVWNSPGQPTETEVLETPGFEAQLALMPVEGLTIKAGGAWQVYDSEAAATMDDDGQGLVNVWASYATGGLTVAGEFNYLLDWEGNADNDATGMGWLAMANYKFTDKFAATLRYSALTIDDEDDDTDDLQNEITFSPSLAITGNWTVLAEYRFEFGKTDQMLYGVESLFTF